MFSGFKLVVTAFSSGDLVLLSSVVSDLHQEYCIEQEPHRVCTGILQ